jgi:hypothetical protein
MAARNMPIIEIMKRIIVLCLLFLALVPALWGEEEAGAEKPEAAEGAAPESGLPRKFRKFSLGMDIEKLKEELKKDGLFSFRGDRDVSFLPLREETLVETTGLSFVRRAFFQLKEGAVFIMAFSLDPRLVDHYSVFTSFVKKYGEPRFLDPGQAVWEDDGARISIERPLTVKYIDKEVFQGLVEEGRTRESGELFLREEFLRGC